jgi:hypothetical protein
MKKIVILLIGMVTFATSPAAGQGMGPDLYEACVNAPKGSVKSEGCNLLLQGISMGLFMGQGLSNSGARTCLPDDESLDVRQTRAIVEKFMREHPEKLNQKIATLVLEALVNAFPCKAEQSSFTAKSLYEWCSTKQDSLKFFDCALYIGGFVAGMASERTVAEAPASLGCIPRNLSGQDAIERFVRMWRSNVEEKGRRVIPGVGPVENVTPQIALTIALTGPCEVKK